MGKGYRPGRLGEEIRKIISDMLLREIKDPRLKESLVSVSAVDVTSDGSYATVFLSTLSMGNKTDEQIEEEKANILAGFAGAKGLIKREIGKKVKLRHVPELIFKMDESLEYGRHMDEILSNLHIPSDEDDEEQNDEE